MEQEVQDLSRKNNVNPREIRRQLNANNTNHKKSRFSEFPELVDLEESSLETSDQPTTPPISYKNALTKSTKTNQKPLSLKNYTHRNASLSTDASNLDHESDETDTTSIIYTPTSPSPISQQQNYNYSQHSSLSQNTLYSPSTLPTITGGIDFSQFAQTFHDMGILEPFIKYASNFVLDNIQNYTPNQTLKDSTKHATQSH
ncbi:hypothetical protein TKK_0003643 [Trichogramma kaykai]